MCLFSATVNWLTASQSLLRRIVEVDHARLRAADVAVAARYSTVTPSTSRRCIARLRRDQLRALRPRELAEGVLERFGGQRRIEPGQRVAQSLRQHHLAVVAPLGREHVRRDVRTVGDPPADAFQPGESGVLDDGLGDATLTVGRLQGDSRRRPA